MCILLFYILNSQIKYLMQAVQRDIDTTYELVAENMQSLGKSECEIEEEMQRVLVLYILKSRNLKRSGDSLWTSQTG